MKIQVDEWAVLVIVSIILLSLIITWIYSYIEDKYFKDENEKYNR